MISFHISLPQLQMFFLIFLRMGAIVMTIPVFSSRSIPLVFKLGLTLAVSIILFPVLKLPPMPVVKDIGLFALGVMGEILLGSVIGLSIQIIFAGIQMAGQFAGYQMGIAIADVMDPDSSEQIPILAEFNNLLALLIFVTSNAHHWFLRALAQSFGQVPPFGFQFGHSVMELLVNLAGNMFVIALKVGAPVIAALLLTSIAFGLIARTVPQMNVFIVAMPLKIGVGFIFLGFSIPFLTPLLSQLFRALAKNILLLLKAMS